jgi:alanyl-tRNA synthetase
VDEHFSLTPDRVFDDPGNIWGPVGDSGPCGPNSEIYCDRGEHYGCGEPDCGPNCERCDRHLEIWNLVFMEWFQERDGTRRSLEKKNIDTGMGLERISLIMQDVASIYDTDLYTPIIERAAAIAGTSYKADPRADVSLRVIADHARAVTFLIADGVLPSNEGRGYVLRRILRRAVRHGKLLGIERPFLTDISDAVIERFAAFHPDLIARQETIRRVITHEEEAFGRTLSTGISRFEALAHAVTTGGGAVIPGEEAFRLYDTYGFPYELTSELARDAGIEVDREGFDRALDVQRRQSRAAIQAFADSGRGRASLYAGAKGAPVEFVGYAFDALDSIVTDLFTVDAAAEHIEAGSPAELVLEQTPFYGESGGQVGDTGTIETDTGVFAVHDTQRPTATLTVHIGEVTEGFRACRSGSAGNDRSRATRRGPAQPHGHARPAPRTARGTWRRSPSGRLAGRAGPLALRLHQHGAAGPGRDRACHPDRGGGGSIRHRGKRGHDVLRRRDSARRDGVVRREVR